MSSLSADLVSGSSIARAISNLGANGREFKFAEIRRAVGVTGARYDRVLSARVYNYLTELKKWGIVRVVPGARSRNKYFRIADEERLRERLGPVLVLAPAPPVANEMSEPAAIPTSEPTPNGQAPGRLSRIEQSVGALEEAFHKLEENLQSAVARVSQLEQRVEELAAICS